MDLFTKCMEPVVSGHLVSVHHLFSSGGLQASTMCTDLFTKCMGPVVSGHFLLFPVLQLPAADRLCAEAPIPTAYLAAPRAQGLAHRWPAAPVSAGQPPPSYSNFVRCSSACSRTHASMACSIEYHTNRLHLTSNCLFGSNACSRTHASTRTRCTTWCW